MLAALLALAATAADPLPLVVIDPGHGGELDGAVGVCGLKEKDVTLHIAQRLDALLRASGKTRTLLTRVGDVTVPLEARPALANRMGAALFISIHANAGTHDTHAGVETYFLSRRASDRRVEAVAHRENEGRQSQKVAPTDPLQQILQGLTLDAAHRESQRFAMRLQNGMADKVNERGRGVLQAPFIVLLEAQMASALVEVGFLTHAEECALLEDPDYRRQVAAALTASILAHLDSERILALGQPAAR